MEERDLGGHRLLGEGLIAFGDATLFGVGETDVTTVTRPGESGSLSRDL